MDAAPLAGKASPPPPVMANCTSPAIIACWTLPSPEKLTGFTSSNPNFLKTPFWLPRSMLANENTNAWPLPTAILSPPKDGAAQPRASAAATRATGPASVARRRGRSPASTGRRAAISGEVGLNALSFDIGVSMEPARRAIQEARSRRRS